MAAAVRESAARLVDHAVNPGGEDVAAVAGDVAGTVVSESSRSGRGDDEDFARLISAAAFGTVSTAYMMGRPQGDDARAEVLREISQPRMPLSPEVQRRLSEVSERLSAELPRVRAAWRWSALVLGARFLLRAGATDQAASLAYFTVLSFFPLMALAIIAAALVADPSSIRPVLGDLVRYYLPASSQLIEESLDGLLENSAPLGLIVLAGLAFAANGLFMAANRAVNRVFGVEKHKTLRGNVAEAVVTGVLGLALLASVGATAFVQVSLGIGGENLQWDGSPSRTLDIGLAVMAAILPAAMTGMVFIVVYHNLPNRNVQWRDAAFGGMIALLLFEAGKHLFFWLSGMAANRIVVCGPVASTVVLLMWAFLAGLIFLCGAGLTRAPGELRPGPPPDRDAYPPSRRRTDGLTKPGPPGDHLAPAGWHHRQPGPQPDPGRGRERGLGDPAAAAPGGHGSHPGFPAPLGPGFPAPGHGSGNRCLDAASDEPGAGRLGGGPPGLPSPLRCPGTGEPPERPGSPAPNPSPGSMPLRRTAPCRVSSPWWTWPCCRSRPRYGRSWTQSRPR